MAWQKIPYISYGANSFVAYVLTNYMQLLLYISYDKNNLYMFVTSKCFLVPITRIYYIWYIGMIKGYHIRIVAGHISKGCTIHVNTLLAYPVVPVMVL